MHFVECFHIYCYLKLFSSFIISLVPILSLGILYIEKESAFEQTLFSLSSFPMMLWLYLLIFTINLNKHIISFDTMNSLEHFL